MKNLYSIPITIGLLTFASLTLPPVIQSQLLENTITQPLMLIIASIISYISFILISTYNLDEAYQELKNLVSQPNIYLTWIGSVCLLLIVK